MKCSAEKILPFKKGDGGLSYLRETSTPTAQGAPVAVPGTAEGDVNGTLCGSIAVINSIFTSLDLWEYRVPLFASTDLKTYLDNIEKQKIKFEEKCV